MGHKGPSIKAQVHRDRGLESKCKSTNHPSTIKEELFTLGNMSVRFTFKPANPSHQISLALMLSSHQCLGIQNATVNMFRLRRLHICHFFHALHKILPFKTAHIFPSSISFSLCPNIHSMPFNSQNPSFSLSDMER